MERFFLHSKNSTPFLMLAVFLCALPGVISQVVHFGIGTLFQVAVAIFACIFLEYLCVLVQKGSKLAFKAILDGSSLVTALLIGVSLPPYVQIWVNLIACFFAIVIGKQVYGGLGNNLFNPAMLGYAVVLVSFPNLLQIGWMQYLAYTQDAFTMATPLLDVKRNAMLSKTSVSIHAKYAWMWVNLCYLLGGIVLIIFQIACFRISLFYILGISVFAIIHQYLGHGSLWWIHLISGASMIGAFFIVTDPVTAPMHLIGRMFYGFFMGFLVWLIRLYGTQLDGVAFATLIGNSCAPLIDSIFYRILPPTPSKG